MQSIAPRGNSSRNSSVPDSNRITTDSYRDAFIEQLAEYFSGFDNHLLGDYARNFLSVLNRSTAS
jgi:hypothetical protein